MTTRKNFPGRKQNRKQYAEERQKAREERSPQDQLKELDRRLGKGVGASKERDRLSKLIDQQKNQNGENNQCGSQ